MISRSCARRTAGRSAGRAGWVARRALGPGTRRGARRARSSASQACAHGAGTPHALARRDQWPSCA
eukprot:1607356-Prymnesium_polylepis.1